MSGTKRERDTLDKIPTRDVGKAHLRQPDIIDKGAQDFIPDNPVNDFFFMMTKEAR